MKTFFKSWKIYEIIFFFLFIIALTVTGIISVTFSSKDGLNYIALISSISALLGVIGGCLNFKRNNICFIFYIISGLIYAYISYIKANYGEAILNGLYLFPSYLISFILFIKNHKKNDNLAKHEFEVKRLSLKGYLLACLIIASITVGYGFVLKAINTNYPFINSFSTAVAVCSIFLASNHYRDQWCFWFFYGIALILLWLLTIQESSSVDVLSFIVQNTCCTILNIYGFVTLFFIKEKKPISQ